MEIIAESLRNKELPNFLIGLGKYKRVPPLDYGNEPNFYAYWWRNEIEPFINSENREYFAANFPQALIELLNYSKDINLGIYTLFSHLVQYYYSLNINKRITLELDLKPIIPLIKETLKIHKKNLLSDKRWAGEDKNSNNNQMGIWGVIIVAANDIVKFGGPNILGDEI